MPLELHNTLTGRREPFRPGDPARVTFYSCGPTVYDYAHIGNFRAFLFADVLRRWLESPLCEVLGADGKPHKGPRRVVHVMNMTDVGHMTDDAGEGGEDRMAVAGRRLSEAKKSGRLPPGAPANFDPTNPWHIAEFYIAAFLEDAKTLGLKVAAERDADATLMPRPTQKIAQMVEMIRSLVAKGCAYAVGPAGAQTVYFDVQKFPDYGRLSGNTLDAVRSGAGGRIAEENQAQKRHPADFMLWKSDPSHVMKWDSPWGAGYPGWHIECSAMARERLGDVIDLHSGGEDNIFPHHECEIAQSRCATGAPAFARCWVHARHLFVEGDKMSKSKGNFYTVRDLVAKGFDPAAIRLELIKTHYRSNANFTEQGLKDSQRMVERWRRIARRLEHEVVFGPWEKSRPGHSVEEQDIRGTIAALSNDLNVAGAIAGLNNLTEFRKDDDGGAQLPNLPDRPMPASEAYAILTHELNSARDQSITAIKRALFHLLDDVLGVIYRPANLGTRDDPRVDQLRLARDAARKAKNWAESDRLRDELIALGYEVLDSKDGTQVKRKASL